MGITICQTCFVCPFYCLRPFSGLLMYSASAQQELCTPPLQQNRTFVFLQQKVHLLQQALMFGA